MTFRFAADRPECVWDTECLPGYWSIGFQSRTDPSRRKVYELYDGHPLDKKAIAKVFRTWRVYGFNSISYDIPMTLYAMSGATNEQLKQANDELITFGVPWWVFLDRVGLSIPDFIDHVDLMNVSPGSPQNNNRSGYGPSLKLYEGRLHSKNMQEMPLHHNTVVGPTERVIIRDYHANDLFGTADLADDLNAQVKLRSLMSQEYDVDVRSKSDAQVAEAVIKVELERTLGRKVYKPDIKVKTFNFRMPAWCKFETPEMRDIADFIGNAEFAVNHAGKVLAPDRLRGLDVRIGQTVYRMGLGGLHSKEKRISHFSDDEIVLRDRDVTSYYPESILQQGMYPEHLGPAFLKIYRKIFDRRIAAKKAKDKNTAETLKIVLNGVFGKLGDVYSIFYAPELMIQVTLSGQLALLMQIERLERAGIRVVSGNTDGIVSKVPRNRSYTFLEVIEEWEEQTGYKTEETQYLSLHSKDVNNYIAVYEEDGKKKVKVKGEYATCGPGLPGASGQKKNPNMQISTDAVVEYLTKGTPVEDTIDFCNDPRKFLVIRKINKGAVNQDGDAIGKALRWYYSNEVSGCFKMAASGNNVPMTHGAKLMMQLPERVPGDIDYDYYARESYAILQDIGMGAVDPALVSRSGRMFAQLPKQKSIHVVNTSTGVAICGKERVSIREAWIEFKAMPEGQRMCSKCKKVYHADEDEDD